jgi:hypothetical protein
MNINKINWENAIIGGVLGTLAFDIIGFFFTGTWWDIPRLLGEKTGLGTAYGIFGHFSNGILLAILYAGIAPSLWGPTWLRTLLFVTAETVALVWFFMFPLLGAGIAGTKMAAIIPLVSLVRHIFYGVPVWYFVHKFQSVQGSE